MREGASSRVVGAVALLAMLLALVTLVRHTSHRPGTPFGDFSHLTLGSGCLLQGCNPYDAAALNQQARIRHQHRPLVWPQAPVYPPSSLLLALPFAQLGWPAAGLAFDYVSGLAFGLVCVLMVWHLRLGPGPATLILLTGLLCNPIISTLEFANPALGTVALTGLACLLLLNILPAPATLQSLAWIALGVALALKPQLVVGVAAMLLCRRDTRIPALKACALSFVLLLAALAAYRLRLGSFGFVATLHANVAASLVPGSTSDFSPANDESFDFLNLQTAFSRLPHIGRTAAEALAWLTTVVLAAAAGWLGWRSNALRRRPWTMLALAAIIGLMPVYHRGYDRVIALLLVPAAVEIGARSRKAAWLYALAVCLWVANDTLMEHRLKRWHFKPQNPAEELVICIILLLSLRYARRPAVHAASLVEVDSIAS